MFFLFDHPYLSNDVIQFDRLGLDLSLHPIEILFVWCGAHYTLEVDGVTLLKYVTSPRNWNVGAMLTEST